MSKKREMSAIDAIYKIVDSIDLLSKRVDTIDSNIKLLNNKISKLNKASSLSSMPQAAASSSFVQDSNVIVNSEKNEESERLVLGNITTYGYIADPNMKPIVGAKINVFDNKNNLIKNVKTNRDGYWSVRLPPGEYGVEYVMDGFKPINKSVNLNGNIKKYEVR